MAISPDSPAQAREMAAKYGIEFPLLEDKDLKLAAKYAGLSDSGYPMPSMYILRADGSVYLRRVATSKDDRLRASELIDHLDAMLQTDASSRVPVRGYNRPLQVSPEVALGAEVTDGETRFATDLSLRVIRSFGRFVSLGAEVGTLALPAREARGALLMQAQVPIWADVGSLYVQVPMGLAHRFDDDAIGGAGLYSGLRLGTTFDGSPTMLLRMEIAFEGTSLDSTSADGVSERIIASRVLLRLGGGWRF